MFNCKVVADSLAPNGRRLTTIEITYPRFIHSEVLTHRDRERNSGSSRAIPWITMRENIKNDPVIPLKWVTEQKGMVGGNHFPEGSGRQIEAERIWLKTRDACLEAAQKLADLGVHKSLCNRVTEPWMWITVVMTATQWTHFLKLRNHPEAEQHFQHIARMIEESLANSFPIETLVNGWHRPYVDDQDINDVGKKMMEIDWSKLSNTTVYRIQGSAPHCRTDEFLNMISVARCARVSYVQYGEKARSFQKDLELFDRLLCGSQMTKKENEQIAWDNLPHISPFGHIAQAMGRADKYTRSGPFRGWFQYRKTFQNEYIDD